MEIERLPTILYCLPKCPVENLLWAAEIQVWGLGWKHTMSTLARSFNKHYANSYNVLSTVLCAENTEAR